MFWERVRDGECGGDDCDWWLSMVIERYDEKELV